MNSQADRLLKRAYALSGDESETKALYQDWAQTYDHTMMSGLAYLSPMLVAAAVQELCAKEARILDLGCGTGLLGHELSELGFVALEGLDYSAAMLDQARDKQIYQNLFEVDLNLPLTLEPQSYDALVSCGTFTHGHVGSACLPGLVELLKPGASLIATVHQDLWQAAGFEAVTAELIQQNKACDFDLKPIKLFQTDANETGYLLSFRRDIKR